MRALIPVLLLWLLAGLASAQSVARTFTTGGSFSVFNHAVFSPDGRTAYVAIASLNQVVAFDPFTGVVTRRATVGSQPGKIGLSGDRRRLAVVNTGSDTVSIIDTASFAVVATAFFPGADLIGENNVTFNLDGSRAFVTDDRLSNLWVFNPQPGSGAIIRIFDLGDGPGSSQLSPDGRNLLIPTTRGSKIINFIDASTLVPRPSFLTGESFSQFNNVVFSTSNTAFVASFRTARLLKLDLAGFGHSGATTGLGPAKVGVSPGGIVLVGENSLRALDGAVASSAASSELFFTRLAGASSSLGTAVTEIHLVNPGLRPAAVELKGYDAGGTLRGQVSMTIPSLGKFESRLSELFPSAGDLESGHLEGGHLEVVSSEPLVGQELVSTGEALAALPTQARPLRNRLFSPHLASGGGPSFFTESQAEAQENAISAIV